MFVLSVSGIHTRLPLPLFQIVAQQGGIGDKRVVGRNTQKFPLRRKIVAKQGDNLPGKQVEGVSECEYR